MDYVKVPRPIIKLAAKKLRDLNNKKEQTKKAKLVEDTMELLHDRNLVGAFSEEEKRAELEQMDADELERTKDTIEQYLKKESFRIGRADEKDMPKSDAITEWLLGSRI